MYTVVKGVTEVKDDVDRVAKMKYNRSGHLGWKILEELSLPVLQVRRRISRRGMSRYLQERDDIKKTAGRSWYQQAKGSATWKRWKGDLCPAVDEPRLKEEEYSVYSIIVACRTARIIRRTSIMLKNRVTGGQCCVSIPVC